MIEKFNKMDNSKKIPIAISISIGLIVFIILFSYFQNNNSNYNNLKEDNTKSLVFTINSKENGKYYINVPYVNIAGSLGKSINEDIDSYMQDFMDNDQLISSYQYTINGKVLSLVIKTVDYDVKNVPLVYFKTYNINLEDLVLLTDDDLLAIYNITSENVESIIEKKFAYWYKDIIKEGYLDEEECDYDCFLDYREVDNYLDDISYYIENGNLIVFKPFVFYSIFGEENYFKEDDFKFVLSE